MISIKEENLGKLKTEDVPTIVQIVETLRRNGLQAGLHGTSLWNTKYKDIDLLVCSSSNCTSIFRKALESILKENQGVILEQRGNEKIGLDYDIQIKRIVIHISFVILL